MSHDRELALTEFIRTEEMFRNGEDLWQFFVSFFLFLSLLFLPSVFLFVYKQIFRTVEFTILGK